MESRMFYRNLYPRGNPGPVTHEDLLYPVEILLYI